MPRKTKKNLEAQNSSKTLVIGSEANQLNNFAEAEADLYPEGVEVESSVFLSEENESDGFLAHVTEVSSSDNSENNFADSGDQLEALSSVDLEGSELEGFESAEIDELEFVEDEQAESIVESILFASDRPVSLASIKEVFKGTNIRKDKIKRILDQLATEYASGRRGITLEEITGGYQLRTKIDNMNFLKRTVKSRPFKLSGPALETLAIVAYKQPVVKSEIDQIRGVESGHLLRALMEKGLCNFEGKAENLPGRPMQYGTTRRFLEIFGLRNLKELPSLSQIDELLPEGIGEEEEQKPTLSMVTDSMSQEVKEVSYSQGEEELGKIEDELNTISTSSDFFEQEKIRQKQKREAEKAQDIRDALAVGEDVPKRDLNWLKKYEEALALAEQGLQVPAHFVEDSEVQAEVEHAVHAASEQEADALTHLKVESHADAESDSDSESESESDELPFFEEADETPGELT